jgi:hypothetical protein
MASDPNKDAPEQPRDADQDTELEKAQEDAAEEREDEGGYQ